MIFVICSAMFVILHNRTHGYGYFRSKYDIHKLFYIKMTIKKLFTKKLQNHKKLIIIIEKYVELIGQTQQLLFNDY